MTLPLPELGYRERPADELGYRVGIVLDELAAFAIEHGRSDDELRERLDEAIERAHEDDE